MTSDAERATLLAIARAAIVERASGRPASGGRAEEGLARHAAAFVTLHSGGALRGCIGHLQTDLPLPAVVAKCAVAAANDDPRFPPVTLAEVADLEIEISVLGPLEPVKTLEDIRIGQHGLVVERGWHRGLLLPQVATEWNWDARTFVAHTCEKAGLPPTAWPDGGATLLRFEAEVFGTD
jgi:uncharacterized protein